VARDESKAPALDDDRRSDDGKLDVVYRVDAKGRLVYVNDGWNLFAEQNDTPELIGAAVLGRPLADFIDGPETKHIYEQVFRRVESGVPMKLPYRCDSPTARRRMTLSIAAHGAGEIEFRSHLVEAQSRDSVGLLEPRRLRSAELLTLCSWCNRGLIDDSWHEIEEVITGLRLFDAELPRLTHGMCPECVARLTQDLAL